MSKVINYYPPSHTPKSTTVRIDIDSFIYYYTVLSGIFYAMQAMELLGWSEVSRQSLPNPQDLPGLREFIRYASWSENLVESLACWTCGPGLTVQLGAGSGQVYWPFPISSQEFEMYCMSSGFSKLFLNRLVAKSTLFEYRFDFTDLSSTPTHLDIAMSTLENDSFFCLLRYDIVGRVAKCLLFFKLIDGFGRRPLHITNLIA